MVPSLNPNELTLLLTITEQLQSSLDLRDSLTRVGPLLQQLVGADHVAIAVSRPGSLYDYEWLNNTLPDAFLGNYAVIAERDFVRRAVAAAPNRVLHDMQMITRKEYARHIVRQHAYTTGANIEHALAVMLCHEQAWTSGLSLYRDRTIAFTEHEAALLQMLVPHISNAVRNSREHSLLQRELWLEPVLEHAGVAVLWVDQHGAEVARTPRASVLLESYFPSHERAPGSLPEPLRDYLRRYFELRATTALRAPFCRQHALQSLTISLVAVPGKQIWALVFKEHGLPLELASQLPPRLTTIAGYLLRGYSNEDIATKERRSLATIKQQAGDVCRRLGVKGRRGLIQLASGLRTQSGDDEGDAWGDDEGDA